MQILVGNSIRVRGQRIWKSTFGREKVKEYGNFRANARENRIGEREREKNIYSFSIFIE